MFQIPPHVLENLKCSVCDGYLSTKPLMIKPENEQVCGKCFKIIPTEEKEKCLRQVGMENLAELFIFPCRYNKHGCNYTFAWGNEGNHEEACQYRYWNLSVSSTPSRNSYESDNFHHKSNNETRHGADDFKTSSNHNLKERSYGESLDMKNGNRPEVALSINLSAEEAISLRSKLDLIYNNINDRIPGENIYESILRKYEKHCYNCRAVVESNEYTCLFGHTSCVNCKGNMCVMCVNLLEKQSKTHCKNYQKGCKTVFQQSEINRHQVDCRYNDHKCPLEPCKFKGVLTDLKQHLQQTHLENVYATNELTENFQTKDRTIIFLCYDGVFKCVYFYYKTFVEFFVTYVGSSEKAVSYTYEISVQSNGNSLTIRRSRCSSWNDRMLEKGITYDKKDLVSNNEKKINFEVHLKILHVK